MQELEAAKARAAEELRAAVAAESATAEERGRAAALLAAAEERATLQEQLSFLKAQLQFALKVRSAAKEGRGDTSIAFSSDPPP